MDLKNPKVVVVDFVVVVDLEMTMIVDLEEVLMILIDNAVDDGCC